MPRLFAAVVSPRLRESLRAALGLASIAVLGCVVSGCSTDGQGLQAFAQQTSGGPTLAFESIDGPPPAVFERLVGVLNSEAQGRPVLIAARDTPAAYHVRSYLSAQVRRGRSVIAWVFDVYDHDQQRALRLSGEEPAGKAGRDAWAAADDQVLRRIAQAGLSGIAAFFGRGEALPAPQGPNRGPAIASADDSVAATAPRAALGFNNR
jgi:hypothetical protein